jgi:putative nucleotidyltransferase with HDIG domain
MVILNSKYTFPLFLFPFLKDEIANLAVFPLFLRNQVAAVIIFGTIEPEGFAPEDISQARQFANQVAVSLANAKLVEDLDALNWGTLMALSLAVDAKSAWTAGHSARVTKAAIGIGTVLGLAGPDIEVLRRAGLLHDIGKIATPPEVLDKPESLTLDERRMIQEHPRVGARILEPIEAYASVVPMVLQHHECYDGSGYPDGLAGEKITLGGRILAVADFYDALTSDRPYRKALGQSETLKTIQKEAGRQFDPLVVNAFLKIFTWKKKEQK